MSNLTFSAKGVSETPARIRVNTRQFELVVDEPADLGGEDQAANPVEYILTGLIGCLNVVGHLVAKEQGITLERFEIHAEGPIDPARLFGDLEGNRAGYQSITVDFRIKTDADDQAIQRWREAVEARCPVSDNLANATPVTINVTQTEELAQGEPRP